MQKEEGISFQKWSPEAWGVRTALSTIGLEFGAGNTPVGGTQGAGSWVSLLCGLQQRLLMLQPDGVMSLPPEALAAVLEHRAGHGQDRGSVALWGCPSTAGDEALGHSEGDLCTGCPNLVWLPTEPAWP